MEQWLRDDLAEEQGYIICPLASETYTICNEKCEECEYYKEFSNNPMINIFFSKDIANMELLPYSK